MLLEIGKKYVTLEREILTVIGIVDSKVYPVVCVDRFGQRFTYTYSGIFDIDESKPYRRDIVSEYVEKDIQQTQTLYEQVIEAYNKSQKEEFNKHFNTLSKNLLNRSSFGEREYGYNVKDISDTVRDKIYKELITQGFRVVFVDLYNLKINW